MRSVRGGAVDMDGLGRLLRGYDIRGPMLLDVLVGLKQQDRWELCQAVARWVEASYPAPTRRGGGRGAGREALPGGAEPPRFPKLSPTDDEAELDMGQLLAMQGDGQPALNPLTPQLPVDTVHYNVLISSCAKPRRWRDAIELFERMRKRHVERSTVTYNSLLHVMQRAGRWKLALKLLKLMRKDRVPPDTVTFSSAIAACGGAGQHQRALLLLPLMAKAGVPPNTITFSSCISACEKQGEWRLALAVLDAMQADLGLDLAPDLICCNAAISACARAGEPGEAKRLLREVLPAYGLEPDTRSFNGLLTAHANAEPAQWTEALAVLDAMEAEDGCTPSLISCNAALSALGKAGEWERAMSFLEAMPDQFGQPPDCISYTSAISGCEKAGEWMAAAQLLRQMRERGLRPTMLTYSKVLFAHAAAGQWRVTAELVEAATRDGLLHNALTINRMLEACLAAPAGSSAEAAAAALAAILPILRAATAESAGPTTRDRPFDRESLRLIEALKEKQSAGAALTEAGVEMTAEEWEAAAEAEVEAADLAAEANAKINRLVARLYPLVVTREEKQARLEQADRQSQIDWEKTFPNGFDAKVLAALWDGGAADA